MFRKFLFWLHLLAGVIAGLVILIMSVTGVLLTYEKQMITWFDLRSLPAIQGGENLPVETLLEKAKEKQKKFPSSITFQPGTSNPVQLSFGREIIYQDPTNGEILGAGNLQARAFFRSVTDWHRWLAASDTSRPLGKAITGYSNLAFLFIVLSGAYLWIPRVWTKVSVRAITLFRGGLSGKARDFNWHNVIGIWSLVPLVFIVASGCVISFPWASNLVYTVTGTPVPSPPVPAQKAGGSPGKKKQGEMRSESKSGKGPASVAPVGGAGRPGAFPPPPDDLSLAGLNDLMDKASRQREGWRSISLRLPTSDTAPVSFAIDHGYAGQPQKRFTIVYDRESKEIKSQESYDDLNAGRKARTWLRFVHTGEFYGLLGQTVAGIASAGAVVLTYTGIALSLRRFFAWRSRRKRGSENSKITEEDKVLV